MKAGTPRVARVCYRVDTVGGEDYDREVTAQGFLGPFSYSLRARIATLVPTPVLADEAAARALLDPLIAAWNLDALLSLGPGAFQLNYIHTVLTDTAATGCAHEPEHELPPQLAHLIHSEYPAAPVALGVDADVLLLAEEYSQLLRDPRRLVTSGRAFISLLDRRFIDRQTAARALCVDLRVLQRLAEITSSWGRRNRTDKITTWKATRHISKSERQWIVDLLRALTRRLAQHVAGANPVTLLTRLP